MEKETYVNMPRDAGNARFGNLAMLKSESRTDLVMLHTLIYLVGISRADVAKLTGLTRSRIGHYLNYAEEVPKGRQRQLYFVLEGIIKAFEENLAAVEADPEEVEACLVPETLPVVRAIVEASRKALADFTAANPEVI